MNCSITDSIDNSYFCTQIDKQEMTEQRLGRKMVHMKNSSMKNTSKTSHQGKINIYFCLIIDAKHIIILFEWAEAIRTTVVPIMILIRTTVVPITPLIGTTVVRIRILIGTTGI